MNILLLGSGGREHAIAWKIGQSPLCDALYIAPGNAGTLEEGGNEALKLNDFNSIKSFVIENNIHFVIVGPEDPLALGIVDFFKNDLLLKNIPILGPDQYGAQLESSKDFAKQFMLRHNIPTAQYQTFTQSEKTQAEDYVRKHTLPIVMKADGLAAGKGVVICNSAEEALQFLNEVWEDQKFGVSGNKVVIEQFLSGIELSVFALTDGKNYVILPNAKDYKRIGEGDQGLNTGGMGTVSPVPFADAKFMQSVEETIIKPTIQGLQDENINYKGFVFFGLINVDGSPYVIEYNVRMGDPETEVVFPRIKDDILPILFEAANGNLKTTSLAVHPEYAVCVIAVSGGYPEAYEKGKKIQGLEKVKDSIIFHAGTEENENGIYTTGGRVLAIVSMGDTIKAAQEKSYDALHKISFEKMNYRKDIGNDLLNY